jgi:hypothetical protein
MEPLFLFMGEVRQISSIEPESKDTWLERTIPLIDITLQ